MDHFIGEFLEKCIINTCIDLLSILLLNIYMNLNFGIGVPRNSICIYKVLNNFMKVFSLKDSIGILITRINSTSAADASGGLGVCGQPPRFLRKHGFSHAEAHLGPGMGSRPNLTPTVWPAGGRPPRRAAPPRSLRHQRASGSIPRFLSRGRS